MNLLINILKNMNIFLIIINIILAFILINYISKDYKQVRYIYKSILEVDSDFKKLNPLDLLMVTKSYRNSKNSDDSSWLIIYSLLEKRGNKKKREEIGKEH